MKKRQNRKGEKQELAESAEQVRKKIGKRAYGSSNSVANGMVAISTIGSKPSRK